MNKSVCLLFGLLCFASGLHAEYLVYKLVDGVACPVSEDEYRRAYQEISEYTFPANTNPLSAAVRLSDQDRQDMACDEQAFLQRRMPAGCTLAFVPTTFYQILTLKYWLGLRLLLPEKQGAHVPVVTSLFGFPEHSYFWRGQQSMMTALPLAHPVRDLLISFHGIWSGQRQVSDAESASYDLYRAVNSHEMVLQTAYKINAEMVREHASSLSESMTISQNVMCERLKKLVAYFEHFYKNAHFSFLDNRAQTFLMANGIQEKHYEKLCELFALEFQAHARGEFLLYRCTDKWGGRNNRIDATVTVRHNEQYPNSISYGNTPFDGLFGQECGSMGAMPFAFINRKKNLAYALRVSKYDYLFGGLSSKTLFISPLVTVGSLSGHGEFFHSRTKAFLGKSEKVCGTWWFNGHWYTVPSLFTAKDVAATRNEYEDLFSGYLADNVCFLSNGTEFSDEELIAHQRAPVDFSLFADLWPDRKVSEVNYPPFKTLEYKEEADA